MKKKFGVFFVLFCLVLGVSLKADAAAWPRGRVEVGSSQYNHPECVTVDGNKITGYRFTLWVPPNSTTYPWDSDVPIEAFCFEPLKKNPEYGWDQFEIVRGDDFFGAAIANDIVNVLKVGFPVNTSISDFVSVSEADRLRWAYSTRTAVISEITGELPVSTMSPGPDVIDKVMDLRGLSPTPMPIANLPGLMVNGQQHPPTVVGSGVLGSPATSPLFEVTYNRKGFYEYNLYHIKWDPSTPVGTELWIGDDLNASFDQFIYSAGDDYLRHSTGDPIIYGSWGHVIPAYMKFYFVLPGGTGTAGVTLEAVTNDIADTLWVARHTNDPTNRYQHLLFYIPEMDASASFTVNPLITLPFEFMIDKKSTGGVMLVDVEFEVMDSGGGYHYPPGGGNWRTGPNGTFLVTDLPNIADTYTVREIATPPGHLPAGPWYVTLDSLGNVSSVTGSGGSFSGSVVTLMNQSNMFQFRIMKTNLSGSGVPGAEFTVTGPSGPVTGTGPGGTWVSGPGGVLIVNVTETGTYTVEEVTPPPGYTLSANPVQTVQVPQPPGDRLVFQNTPVTGDVIIQKIDALTRRNIPGSLFRLRGVSNHSVVVPGLGGPQIWNFDNTGIDVSMVVSQGATVPGGAVTHTVTDGVWKLEGLPYGFYIVQEERAPANYSLLPQHTSYAFWLLPPNVKVSASYDAMMNAILAFILPHIANSFAKMV